MTDLELARKAAASLRPYSHNSALMLDGERDGTDVVQSALLAIKDEREAVVKWLMDPERCPFGKAPVFYATAIKKGEHHGTI